MSQPDSITLPVDELNNGTTVNHVYTNYDRSSVRSVYIGANHTSLARNMMTLFRSPAKPVGNFPGVEKISVKLTRDITVNGNDGVTPVKIPDIVEVSFSMPVGMTDADKVLRRQTVIAAVDHAFMEGLTVQLVI